jgi:thioredoxin-like negative regulator of GroEL
MILTRNKAGHGTAILMRGLSLGAAVQELSDAAFGQVLSAPKAVVKFYSPNCPYSRKFAPIYDAVGPGYPDVLFAAVNVDQNIQNAGKYRFQMLPTVIFFANGQEVGRAEGIQDQGDFTSELSRAFSGTPAAAAPNVAPQGCPVAIAPPPASSTLSTVGYVLGGATVVGVLGTAAYFLLRK